VGTGDTQSTDLTTVVNLPAGVATYLDVTAVARNRNHVHVRHVRVKVKSERSVARAVGGRIQGGG